MSRIRFENVSRFAVVPSLIEYVGCKLKHGMKDTTHVACNISAALAQTYVGEGLVCTGRTICELRDQMGS